MNTKKCLFCGQEFTPRNNRQMYCDRDHYRQCPSCGLIYLEKYSENLKKPPRLCSSNCRIKHMIPDYIEHDIILDAANFVIVDSTTPRQKYDNLHISQHYHRIGINCVHVFPGDNIDRIIKQQDVVSVQDASEFKVYKLNLDYAAEFLVTNDIVKYYKNTALAIGLVKDYEIYQVMTFASPRYDRKFDYEIIRCCNKLGYVIDDGLDLLSSTASLQFGITNCIAYQDRSKCFAASKLQRIGMKLHHTNPPHKRSSGVYDCGTYVLVF